MPNEESIILDNNKYAFGYSVSDFFKNQYNMILLYYCQPWYKCPLIFGKSCYLVINVVNQINQNSVLPGSTYHKINN
jgi:hypothetical protein